MKYMLDTMKSEQDHQMTSDSDLQPNLIQLDNDCYRLDFPNQSVSVALFLEPDIATGAVAEDSDSIAVICGCCNLNCLIGGGKIVQFNLRQSEWFPVYSTENISWLSIELQYGPIDLYKPDKVDPESSLLNSVLQVVSSNSDRFSNRKFCALACKPLRPVGYGEAFAKHHIFKYVLAPPKHHPLSLQLVSESPTHRLYLGSVKLLRSVSDEFRVHLPDDQLWTGRIGDAVAAAAAAACNQKDKKQQQFVVCGPRNSGKSSISRCLVNQLLSAGVDGVAYLDCDPGQTEFTPPGFLSLTLVRQPLLGPPFTHQAFAAQELPKDTCASVTGATSDCSTDDSTSREQDHRPSIIAACCLGGCSPGSPTDYLSAVARLTALASELSHPLVVNTMGWTNGLGLVLLCETIRLLSPSYLIQIESELPSRNLPSLLTPDYLWNDSSSPRLRSWQPPLPMTTTTTNNTTNSDKSAMAQYLLICVPGKLRSQPTRYGAPQQRELSVLATILPLNNCPVYRVPFHTLEGVFVAGSGRDSLSAGSLDKVLNASLVGLCTIDEDNFDQSADNPTSSSQAKNHRLLCRLNRMPDRHGCIGVGLVRCVDTARHELCIQTWLQPDRLPRVQFILHCVPDLPLPFLARLQPKPLDDALSADSPTVAPPPYVGDMPDCGIGSLRLRAERRPLKHRHLAKR